MKTLHLVIVLLLISTAALSQADDKTTDEWMYISTTKKGAEYYVSTRCDSKTDTTVNVWFKTILKNFTKADGEFAEKVEVKTLASFKCKRLEFRELRSITYVNDKFADDKYHPVSGYKIPNKGSALETIATAVCYMFYKEK